MLVQPFVSIIVINFNGKHHLEACFKSLLHQSYPADKIEIILIDNNSKDGSREFMSAHFPTVKVIHNVENVGFASAVNQAAKVAVGTYIALINNDAYADHNWLMAMVTTLDQHRNNDVVCVGAKILDWYGKTIDFVGGGTNFYGHADQFFHRVPVGTIDPVQQEVLFACGGAMLVDRDVFIGSGGFDDDYFAYFEDVDFGWRLWIYGYRVLYEPAAIIYHRSHGTSSTMYQHQVEVLGERNTLLTIIKNYDDAHLSTILTPALLLMIKRSLLFAGNSINRHAFDLRQRDKHPTDLTVSVPKIMLSSLVATSDILQDFSHVWRKRSEVQAHRKRSDADIFALFGKVMGTNFTDQSYLNLHQELAKAFDLHTMFSGKRASRVLIISGDPLSSQLAGVGIRVVEMARYLAKECTVILAAPESADVQIDGVQCAVFNREDQETIRLLATQAEIVIIHGFTLQHFPILKSINRILVVDLYDPFILSNIELHMQHTLDAATHAMNVDRNVLNELLTYGDFFICASEKQRDLWIGALTLAGRITPSIYDDDPTLHSLIDIVPFGIPDLPPSATKRVMKGVVPGIDEHDFVVLWGGGIWDWLDPLTVIHAIHVISQQRTDVKLFFMGKGHPNPDDVPQMAMYAKSVALAKELGLYNTYVFFNDQWVPYADRANYLLEADIGVSAHFDHIETRFAFRTRILDYIWANLPMVVSRGDELATIIQQEHLGFAVDVCNSEQFAQAILAILAHENPQQDYQTAFTHIRSKFLWQHTLEPLVNFCKQPRYTSKKYLDTTKVDTEPKLVDFNMEQFHEMHRIVEEKNQHILRLETLIKQLESGKIMRMLQFVQQLKR